MQTTTEILTDIRLLQGIQKTHPVNSPEWIKASNRLAPLFVEMARRSVADRAATIKAEAEVPL